MLLLFQAFPFALYQEVDNEPAKIYVQNSAYGKSNFVGRKWSRILTEDATFTAPNGTCGYATTAGSATTAGYATTAGSAPASDVYSWAKASTKPSYNFNEIQDAADLGVSIGTVTRRVLLTRTKTNQGYRSRAAIGLTNESGKFSPVILSVGTNDGGTSWMDYTFTADGWFHSEKVRSRNVTIWGNQVTDDSKGLFIQASDWSNRAWITWNGNTETTDYLNIHSVYGNINLTPAKNVGIGTTSPSQKLHVEGNIYANGRASINTTSTTGILNVSRGSTNDYAIDTLGQQRYKYDSGDTSNLSIGLFSSNKCPFIRFTNTLNTYVDLQFVPVLTNNEVTDYLFQIGYSDITTRIFSKNFRIYTAKSLEDSTQVQALQAISNGRILVGSTTQLVRDNTDCRLVVEGNMCTNSTNGSFIKIGGVYLIYDSDSNSIKVAGNAAGTTAANFYATGAVSALGANTSSGGGSGGDVYWSQLINGTGGDEQISASLLHNVTKTLSIYYDENPVAISYNGRSTQGTPVLITRSYAEGRYVKQSGNAIISGTATIGGNMTIGATEAVGSVNSQVIQTLNSRAIYIKTGTAPNYVDGTWSNTSDIRLKDIINNVGASVDQIANAPIFNYKWKSGGVSIMLGSSAQYWQNVFQHAVEIGPENYLYMDYSSVALASAVMVARKVVNHEERIRQLETENEKLRKLLNIA